MRKRITIITLCFLLCLLAFTGCSNQLSSEAKAYKEETLNLYTSRATQLITESLTEKYEKDITITNLDIIANLDYSFGFTSEPYKKVATGKAQIDGKEFDIYLKWDIDNNPANFICCDNMEKEIILKDLDKYFTDLYGQKPYAVYYEVFSSLGYEFKKEDGMLKEKYSGNIEDYMDEFSGLIKIAVAYENLDNIFLENTINEEGITVNGIPKVLSKAKNVYIINTFKDKLTEKELKTIISRSKINEFLPLVKEYIQFEGDGIRQWKNNMSNFAEFTYKGTITDKTILFKNNCGLTLEDWENTLFKDISKYKVVSDWYYAPEKNSAFYLSEDYLDTESTVYTVLFCHKNSENNIRYYYKVITSNDSGYLMIEPKQENTWFVVCEQEDTTPEIFKKIDGFIKNLIQNIPF